MTALSKLQAIDLGGKRIRCATLGCAPVATNRGQSSLFDYCEHPLGVRTGARVDTKTPPKGLDIVGSS